MRPRVSLLVILGILLVVTTDVLGVEEVVPRYAEKPLANEAQLTRDNVQLALETIRKHQSGPIVRRDAHAKHHGCVRGELTVLPLIPREARVGIFKEPRSYKLWARFSNASSRMQSDSAPDARGLAIKLFGVDGPKLLDVEPDLRTQDLLFATFPTFLTHDAAEYAELTRATIDGKPPVAFLASHPAIARALVESFGKGARIGNMLQTRYWSAAPYALGARAVKYALKPCAGAAAVDGAGPHENALRETLVKHLAEHEGCFDMFIQFYRDDEKTPIEDYLKEWTEEDAPLVPVATIRIPRQKFDAPAQDRFCEDLSFTPWRGLKEHRPLGNLNRVRKAVYEAVSIERHKANQSKVPVPTGEETF